MPSLVPAVDRRSTRTFVGWLLALAAVLSALLPLTPARAAAEPSVPYWVVPGDPGTASDLTLPGVADRLLGDSERWPEIYELNRGRAQPDGLTLTDPARLRAGWVLVLPANASSGEIRIGPPPAVEQPAAPRANPPSGPPPAPLPAGPGTGQTRILGLSPAVAAVTVLGVLLLAGGLVVAAAVVRRRGSRPVAPSPVPTGSRAVLDRALRQLAARTPQPQVYAAVVGPDRVSLRLAPAVPDAPSPWQPREQGAVWEAPNWQLDDGATGSGSSALPLLATVGTIGGELTVVNLGRAPGVVALTGDRAVSTAVVGAFLDEIGADPAAASVAITVVGPAPGTRLPVGRVRATADATGVVDLLATGPVGTRPDDTGAVVPGPLRGHLVVVTAPVASSVVERLGALATLSDDTAAVLVLGDVPNAAWRFEAGADGSLDVGVLGLRLDPPQVPRFRGALTYGSRG
ncbi:LysM peptidoglycan-binding domain-containing protein [Micromonospora sp. NPDC050397]|uniref:LysM peptidoglycan-binding domain-containing protein n=1 Tax=Micromonospora sp. NPDC050397 TaxID=3364279 RepID=UPI0038504F57